MDWLQDSTTDDSHPLRRLNPCVGDQARAAAIGKPCPEPVEQDNGTTAEPDKKIEVNSTPKAAKQMFRLGGSRIWNCR